MHRAAERRLMNAQLGTKGGLIVLFKDKNNDHPGNDKNQKLILLLLPYSRKLIESPIMRHSNHV